jgi:CRP-like cAMP-binding protein
MTGTSLVEPVRTRVARPQQPIDDRRARAAGTAAPTAIDDGRKLLGECKLFRDLGERERDAFFARAHIRACSAGETIFLQGSPGTNLMVVLSGSVRISIPSPGGKEELVLVLLQPGEVFGELAMLDGKERAADAKAATPCHLAILERRDVLALFDRHPKIWSKLVEMLCDRLRNTDQQIADLALLDVPARLAKTLLRIAKSDRPATNSGRPLHVRLYQRELGNICGASRESVNKCLGNWQRRGIVQIDEGVVMVANRTALQDLAELEL